MKVIFSPIPSAAAICGKPVPKPGEQLRLTTHCLSVKCADGTLLYHTLTDAMILLEGEESPEDFETELFGLRFLVSISFDENGYSDGARRIFSAMRPHDSKLKSFTVLTTTDCNARCFYCYEKGIPHLTMTEQTAEDVASFMLRRGGQKLSLNWFGGEPLLNHSAVTLISRRLKAAGVKFDALIVTNGYLFNSSIISEAKSLWNLKKAQITLDGTKEVYLRTKAYVNRDPNAFERVLDNIEALLDQNISVSVRLNVNRDNYEDILSLCDFLGDRFQGGRNGLIVAPVMLKSFGNDVHAFKTESGIIQANRVLRDKLKNLSLLTDSHISRTITCNRCQADNDNAVVIHPDGSLGKCEHYDQSEIIGSIYGDELDTGIIRSWKERTQESRLCADCPLYPTCIPLAKCPWTKDGCKESTRQLKIEKLTDKILKTYLDSKKVTI